MYHTTLSFSYIIITCADKRSYVEILYIILYFHQSNRCIETVIKLGTLPVPIIP